MAGIAAPKIYVQHIHFKNAKHLSSARMWCAWFNVTKIIQTTLIIIITKMLVRYHKYVSLDQGKKTRFKDFAEKIFCRSFLCTPGKIISVQPSIP